MHSRHVEESRTTQAELGDSGGAPRLSRTASYPRKTVDRLSGGRGTTRAEDAQGTPDQSHISPSILVYEDEPGGAS